MPVRTRALVISGYGQKTKIRLSNQKCYISAKRHHIPLLVSGDMVYYQVLANDQYIITDLLARQNVLKHGQKPIAANLDYLLLVVAISPNYQLDLIDRYLVLAKMLGIRVQILLNKIDLSEDIAQIKRDFLAYIQLGYKVHYLSVLKKIGLEFLPSLARKRCLLVGQSGVGKSSLINYISPKAHLKTKALNQKAHGRHTTSNTILYHTPFGELIDSPGLHQLNLKNLDKQTIMQGFVEIGQFSKNCKFRDCTHINEPDCAVKSAVKNGHVHPSRYQNYQQLLQNKTTV